jgi:hypothetical protein
MRLSWFPTKRGGDAFKRSARRDSSDRASAGLEGWFAQHRGDVIRLREAMTILHM